MAPGAHILYVGRGPARNIVAGRVLLTASSAAHSANMVVHSYGNAGAEDVPATTSGVFNQIAVQARAGSLGVYFSPVTPVTRRPASAGRGDFSAVDPWVTAVGVTSLGIGQHNNVVFPDPVGRLAVHLVRCLDRAEVRIGFRWRHQPAVRPSRSNQQGVFPTRWRRKPETGYQPGSMVPDISRLADPTPVSSSG